MHTMTTFFASFHASPFGIVVFCALAVSSCLLCLRRLVLPLLLQWLQLRALLLELLELRFAVLWLLALLLVSVGLLPLRLVLLFLQLLLGWAAIASSCGVLVAGDFVGLGLVSVAATARSAVAVVADAAARVGVSC
eukprot:TRINITY_DN35083_c0_g1_i1.p2 TRINITY_DN35083_c0_g1~~TRINITY_DN35083_c0_g1_i1.p2  ORF type:complete len:136 (+),score=21.67 TRINITY_DN35083_c0_g1_i1:134-541(+)